MNHYLNLYTADVILGKSPRYTAECFQILKLLGCMRNTTLTFVVWVVVLIAAAELNSAAYGYLYFPLIDPLTSNVNYGRVFPDMLLLVTNVITFAAAGALIAWRMKGKVGSVVAGMALGSVWLGAEISLSMPWFQLMPSHPTLYDRILAFLGSISAPLSGALGAWLYCVSRKSREVAANAT